MFEIYAGAAVHFLVLEIYAGATVHSPVRNIQETGDIEDLQILGSEELVCFSPLKRALRVMVQC
jgi:hypothetical protein